MARKGSFRPSAGLIACIAVISVLAFLTTDVNAQCYCYSGKVIYSNAYCYPSWTSNRYWILNASQYQYRIRCQRRGNTVHGNSWWNYIQLPSGSYCYVNDWYLKTGCATKCSNLPICYV